VMVCIKSERWDRVTNTKRSASRGRMAVHVKFRLDGVRATRSARSRARVVQGFRVQQAPLPVRREA
jgi:hypothetical protein